MAKILKLIDCRLATTEELFKYKKNPLKLNPFPGYTSDQWGIKAHNRPWIVDKRKFKKGMKVIEVGGAYSTLPKYLADKFGVEAWIGDDFGAYSHEKKLWTRWGDPSKLPVINKPVKYVYEPFGKYSDAYPSNYFDMIFSVSTLEHIPKKLHVDVFKDMNRCLKNNGTQLHTIDISFSTKSALLWSVTENIPIINRIGLLESQILHWIHVLKASGIEINTNIPKTINVFKRQILTESPDVVFRFYPPNNTVKPFFPPASLLLTIKAHR